MYFPYWPVFGVEEAIRKNHISLPSYGTHLVVIRDKCLILHWLNRACNLFLDGHTLTLQDTDTQIFHQLNVKLQDILKAVKALASAGRKS
jgi:hypothetical protein